MFSRLKLQRKPWPTFNLSSRSLPSLSTSRIPLSATDSTTDNSQRRSVWTLSPLVEEANKVTLWRCERFFTFKADQLHHSSPTPAIEEQLRKKRAATNKREATIVVNGALPTDHKFYACWNPAHVRVCADGGAGRLYKLNKDLYVPDHIIGDLDSAPRDVLDYYKNKGVSIIQETDQDSTDLQKAFALLKKIEVLPHGMFETVNVLGGLGGCLSHEMQNLNTLYQALGKKVFLVSPGNIAFLLPKGRHIIRIYRKAEDKDDDEQGTHESIDDTWSPPKTVYCGILPLGEKCLNASTKGLRWNLNQQPLEFGGLLSTSNEFLHNIAEVEVSNPVVWTFDFRSDTC